MARTTPRLFYEFFVQPNYADFVAQPRDIRRGFNASIAAFQQADIFYRYYAKRDPSKIAKWPKLKNLHVHLAQLDPHYLTIQSVATVYKHLYSDGGHYDVGSPADLWGIVLPTSETKICLDWGTAADASQVIVRRKKKSEISLLAALETVVEHLWPDFLPIESDDDD